MGLTASSEQGRVAFHAGLVLMTTMILTSKCEKEMEAESAVRHCARTRDGARPDTSLQVDVQVWVSGV